MIAGRYCLMSAEPHRRVGRRAGRKQREPSEPRTMTEAPAGRPERQRKDDRDQIPGLAAGGLDKLGALIREDVEILERVQKPALFPGGSGRVIDDRTFLPDALHVGGEQVTIGFGLLRQGGKIVGLGNARRTVEIVHVLD